MSEPGRVLAQVFVAGRARTKGSLKPIHIRGGKGRPCRVSLTEDHELATPWKKTMIRELRRAYGNPPVPHAGPVEVHAFYRFERARSVASERLPEGEDVFWPSHDTLWPTSADIGDEDKLRRNVLDALTQAGIIADDRLVVGGYNLKRWCRPDEEPGVAFVVRAAYTPEYCVSLEEALLGG